MWGLFALNWTLGQLYHKIDFFQKFLTEEVVTVPVWDTSSLHITAKNRIYLWIHFLIQVALGWVPVKVLFWTGLSFHPVLIWETSQTSRGYGLNFTPLCVNIQSCWGIFSVFMYFEHFDRLKSNLRNIRQLHTTSVLSIRFRTWGTRGFGLGFAWILVKHGWME